MAAISLCHVSLSASLPHNSSHPGRATWHVQGLPCGTSLSPSRMCQGPTSRVRVRVRALEQGGLGQVEKDFGGSEPPSGGYSGGNSGGNSGGGGGGEGASDDGFSLWGQYMYLLQIAPVRTKSITSMLLNSLGDLLCQMGVEERRELDAKRLGISAILGLLLVGPTLHYWYASLGQIVTVGGNLGAGLQLFLDQFVFSPTFICVFFTALFTLEGRPQDIGPKLKQDWGTTVVTNWKIWIPFQFLNFRLIPPPLRVAVANVIALAWNVYLSFASHTKIKAAVKSAD